MKRLIYGLVLFLILLSVGSRTKGFAETVSTQTAVTITIKQAPAIVPTPNQYLPIPNYAKLCDGSIKGKLPRTSGQMVAWWEIPLGMLCFLEAGFLIYLTRFKRRKKEMK